MFCEKCGTQINDEAIVCPSCGVGTSNYHKAASASSSAQPINITNVNTNTNTNTTGQVVYPAKSKMTALLLCFFLGEFGVHRLYVGKIGSGLIYMFTFGLFGIGWILDLITILVGSFRDKYGYPLQ